MKTYTICFFLGVTIYNSVIAPSIASAQPGVERSLTSYETEIQQWHKERMEKLKSEMGSLALVGRYWLEEGINSFGGDPSTKIPFPKGKVPPHMGAFKLNKIGRAHV